MTVCRNFLKWLGRYGAIGVSTVAVGLYQPVGASDYQHSETIRRAEEALTTDRPDHAMVLLQHHPERVEFGIVRSLWHRALLAQGRVLEAQQSLAEIEQWPTKWQGFWYQQRAWCAVGLGHDDQALDFFAQALRRGGLPWWLIVACWAWQRVRGVSSDLNWLSKRFGASGLIYRTVSYGHFAGSRVARSP